MMAAILFTLNADGYDIQPANPAQHHHHHEHPFIDLQMEDSINQDNTAWQTILSLLILGKPLDKQITAVIAVSSVAALGLISNLIQ